MVNADADILIAGAGPAGAWAARALAAAGARVRLFDASHPREKPCGGGLTARCLDLLGDAIALPAAIAVSHVRFQAPPVGREAYPPGRRGVPSVTVPTDAASPAASGRSSPRLVVVDRTRFDAALLEAAERAGAELVPERVRALTVAPQGVTVRTATHQFRGRYLIGADGASSLVRHQLARPLPRPSLSIALGVYVRDASSTEIVIRFVTRPQGYIWSFPRADHLAVGICAAADRSTPRELRRHLDAWLAAEGLADGRRLDRYSWPIPSPDAAGCRAGVPSGDRWLLAGDAAGLVDPLTREGIYYALASGACAADALLDGTGSPSDRYADALRRTLLPELAQAARARGSFFSPVVSRLWVDALTVSPRVRRLGLDVVLGCVGYHHLRRTALRRLEPGAAMRILGRQAGRYVGLAS
jgi:menaquinone-9 beta-reductase